MITEQGATWPSTTRPRAAGQNWPDTLASLAKKMSTMFFQAIIAGLVLSMGTHPSAQGQMPPSQAELSAYVGLHKAAADGNLDEIRTLLLATPDPNLRDKAGRTPLHVAAFQSRYDAVRALVTSGGDINALENDRYDVITIAAVKDDVRMVKLAIELGGNPGAITSRYDGTALIAAAHLGHEAVVRHSITSTILAGRPP
jgi:ankyrin repeat protein